MKYLLYGWYISIYKMNGLLSFCLKSYLSLKQVIPNCFSTPKVQNPVITNIAIGDEESQYEPSHGKTCFCSYALKRRSELLFSLHI